MNPSAARWSTASRWTGWLATNRLAAVWLVSAVVITVVAAKAAPEAYREPASLADFSDADRAEMRRTLAELHLSPAFLARYEVATFAIGALVELAIGWLLTRRAPRTYFTCYLAFIFLANVNAQYPPSIEDMLPGQPIAQAITRLTTAVAISGFFVLPFVFPDGRFVPRWTVLLAAYLVFGVGSFAFAPWLDPTGSGKLPAAVEGAISALFALAAIVAVAYRYRAVSTPEQRRQTRWVGFGLMVGFPGFLLGDALMRNIDATPVGIACLLGFLIVSPITSMVLAVTLGIAILRHRLFDIDVILNRTMVWLTMSIAVTGAYVGVVLGLGGLIGTDGSLLLSLLATGLVAIGFQPLHLRVQRLTTRLLFGDRDDPYAVVSRLGQQIEGALNPAELLPAIVRTIADALRLPYATLFFDRASEPVLVASAGIASAPTMDLPLTYQGQPVGTLAVAPRSPGEVFSQAEWRLLEDLARQIGVAARTVSLAADLQQSRERIVTSREEERRRLRRDLHDGLGAQLAALTMQTGSALRLLRSDPEATEGKLRELQEELRTAVADVRRLVLGLRPPALDELGLTGALRTRLERLDQGGIDADAPALRVRLEATDPLPPLSAAAEVAAFRVVEEAVTNVVKHAQAGQVIVTLGMVEGTLTITVADDGIGFTPLGDGTGVGLLSIRERAAELGGSDAIATGPDDRGTVVRVAIPNASAQGKDEPWTASES